MEALIVLAVIIVIAAPIITLILASQIRNTMSREFRNVSDKIEALAEQVKHLKSAGVVKDQIVSEEEFTEQRAVKPVIVEKPIIVPPKIETAFPPLKDLEPEPVKIPEPEKVEETVMQHIEVPVEESSVFNPEPEPVKPPKPNFFERNPDLEKFIGENLANKIGIGILVIGIGFFVKYAIDQDWINEIGRVFIGIVCSGILLGVAHKLRKSFAGFSSVLVGGGIAVLYLTIAIAFHEYALFSQTIAFLLMVVITGFAIVFSLAYDRKELAVLSLLGGFASPFMVSTGEGNYIALFTYITILDVGMMVLSYYKKWSIINIIAYVFTVILFGSWSTTMFDHEKPGMVAGAMAFATGFYFIFFAMNLINNIRENKPFKALDFTLLLSNTFFYYGAGMYILDSESTRMYQGLFTVALALFNFGFAYSLFKSSKADKNLVYLLIGLVLTFISLAAPIQLEGNYITLFWAAEAVLLLWLSQKSGIKLMKLSSYAVMGLMVISLMMDLQQVYIYVYMEEGMAPEINIIFNKGYLTALVAVASLVGTILLLRKEEASKFIVGYGTGLRVALVLLVYIMNRLELGHHIDYVFADDYYSILMSIGAYNITFILVLLLVEKKLLKQRPDLSDLFIFWGGLAVVFYTLFYFPQVVSAREDLIIQKTGSAAMLIHYIMVVMIIPIAAICIAKNQKMVEFNLRTKNAHSWFYVAFFVFLASTELDNLILLMVGTAENYWHVLSQNHKIGWPILWGIASFIVIFVGLKLKRKHLRIISLTLFLITLVKLFAVDIRGISEGGKIAAFISLGILLLTVSFMYQRLKKILLTDDPAPIESNENKPVE